MQKSKNFIPNKSNFNSLRASRLSLRSWRSISWLIRFCSFASSLRQQAILKQSKEKILNSCFGAASPHKCEREARPHFCRWQKERAEEGAAKRAEPKRRTRKLNRKTDLMCERIEWERKCFHNSVVGRFILNCENQLIKCDWKHSERPKWTLVQKQK